MKKVKIPPKTARRSYAIASFILTSLRDVENKNKDLTRVHTQSIRAMRVFASKVDKDWFDEFIDQLGDIWQEAGDANGMKVKIENADMIVESLCYILPDGEFKKFFGTNKYVRDKSKDDKESQKLSLSIALSISIALDDMMDTHPHIMNLPKPKKVKKKKVKEKSKKQKIHEENEARIREAKKRKGEAMQALRERIQAAKKKAKQKEEA